MDLKITGKIVLVTGAGNGIGAAIAKVLSEEGARVAVADINGAAAERQAKAITAAGGHAAPFTADVTSATSVATLEESVRAKLGTIDILVNNAGFTRDKRILQMDETADWDSVIDVILKGAFLCTRAVTRGMTEAGWGRIVNISSRAYLGNPGQANYSAAKAGIVGFTRAMALELGRYNVTVNAVAPGIVDTEMVRALPHFEKIRAAAEKNTPLPRLGHIEDIANAVAFLCSERASYITGDVMHVTGGRY